MPTAARQRSRTLITRRSGLAQQLDLFKSALFEALKQAWGSAPGTSVREPREESDVDEGPIRAFQTRWAAVTGQMVIIAHQIDPGGTEAALARLGCAQLEPLFAGHPAQLAAADRAFAALARSPARESFCQLVRPPGTLRTNRRPLPIPINRSRPAALINLSCALTDLHWG